MKIKNAEDQLKGAYCESAELIDQGREGLLLHLKKDGIYFDVVFYPYAECCSYSYIESINDIDDLNESVIYDFYIESNDRDDDEDEHGNTIRYHFYKFKTSKGYVDIEMRNESNGYYDGHLEIYYRNFDVRYYYAAEQLVIEYPTTQALYATNASPAFFGPKDKDWQIESWGGPRHYTIDNLGPKIIGFMKTSRYKDGHTHRQIEKLMPTGLPASFYEDN